MSKNVNIGCPPAYSGFIVTSALIKHKFCALFEETQLRNEKQKKNLWANTFEKLGAFLFWTAP